jgi:hypothetical protein
MDEVNTVNRGSGVVRSEDKPPLRNRRSAAAWTWLMVLSLTIVVFASVLAVWNWAPTIIHQTTPMGISSHDLVLTPLSLPKCLNATGKTNLIEAENACPGTLSWRQTLPDGPSDAINAFPVPASINIGQDVHLYVSTTAASYMFSVYRVGWYQAYGGRLMYTSPTIQGINQLPPLQYPLTRMATCVNWRDPVTLNIPTSWVSGVYIVKFITSQGDMRYTYFIVRNDASHAPVFYQVALMTYQAYNTFGGRSLYRGDIADKYDFAGRSYMVSFDRPFAIESGLGHMPIFDGPIIRFLERAGYNMTYMADEDLVQHPDTLKAHRLLIVGGHDEYWTARMRQAVTSMRDHGISLAFFQANDVYWQVRLANSPLGSDRIMISYKQAELDPFSKIDPSAVTTLWANAPVSMPQNSLLGEMFICIPKYPAPLILNSGALPYLKGTDLHPGSMIPKMVFGEADGYVVNGFQPANVTILAASPVLCKWSNQVMTSNATIYTAPSGAKVFDAGTFYWYLGLDTSWNSVTGASNDKSYVSAYERFTINILTQLLSRRA